MRAKKSLSQNFLFDPSILSNIIREAGITREDTVVEIGPGPGALTLLLAEHAREVIAIEFDKALYEKLDEKIKSEDIENITLIRADALRFDYGTAGRFKVVANIPYHITTPLIFKLLEYRRNLDSMTLTVQKEVAERIAARPGGKDYGVLSIMVQYYGRPEIKFIIPKGAFRPVPKVDSACLHIDILKEPGVRVKDEECFFRVVRTAFTQRRKTILNGLRTFRPDIKEILARAGIEPSRRPETLSMEEFARLSDKLCK